MSWFDDNAPTGGGAMTGGPVASQPGPGTPTGGGQDIQSWMLAQLKAGVPPQQVAQMANKQFGLTTGGEAVYYPDTNTIGLPGFYLAGPTDKPDSPAGWGAVQRSGGGSGGSSGSPGGIPGMDPGYTFRFNQGVRALQASAAARGTLLTGGMLKALALFGQDAASQEYANAFDRQYRLAALGENAAAGQGNFGQNYASNATNTIEGNANVQGQAGMTQANLYNNLAGNLGGLALYSSGYRRPASSTPGGGFGATDPLT